ncbi:hypothetical protein [Roseicyclus mahoneyensis]|uniref:Lipoprotein n=1 Tax=Roseicyclus mahoneyensis TaxID=164332 RepID=A0A316GKB4_9RHOB|nr:hypothetical protein [Roseicyclus mahoneyensis]PWK61076.1 hypothetical protein C7455_103276 [Roseicyclus mahoneyensis]
MTRGRSGLLALAGLCAVAACTAPEGPRPGSMPPASYDGVQTRLLDDDLVNFRVQMTGVATRDDLDAYARCAAAQYALIRGFGFARHVRTNVQEQGGVWVADAVYTISPALPRGLQTLDAEVVAAACADQGIPTV